MKNLIVIGLFVLLVLSHLYPGSPVATLAMLTALVAIGGACVKLGEYIWGPPRNDYDSLIITDSWNFSGCQLFFSIFLLVYMSRAGKAW